MNDTERYQVCMYTFQIKSKHLLIPRIARILVALPNEILSTQFHLILEKKFVRVLSLSL